MRNSLLFADETKRRSFFLLVAFSLFCFSLTVARCIYTGRRMFLFLDWNLFLAGLPWIVSTLLVLHPGKKNKGIFSWLAIITWLLFFPNAPYMITDLFHLRTATDSPKWFDLMLVFSFAWTGIIAGFLSLRDIEQLLHSRLRGKFVRAVIGIMLFASGFGIYLGRYLRQNSWDMLSGSQNIFHEIAQRFLHPQVHPRTWGMTLLFGIFLNLAYWSVGLFGNAKPAQKEISTGTVEQ
ncbi:MAG TPA: DUF1361 domain-containing protein [Bacteroidia bacterium]|nr:DUF1361 domain-containing protein [Bacteroidia bacterium]